MFNNFIPPAKRACVTVVHFVAIRTFFHLFVSFVCFHGLYKAMFVPEYVKVCKRMFLHQIRQKVACFCNIPQCFEMRG